MALGWCLALTSANLSGLESQIHREGQAVDREKTQDTKANDRISVNVTVTFYKAGKGPSSISVTRAAMGERSLRVKVTWAKRGCPFRV